MLTCYWSIHMNAVWFNLQWRRQNSLVQFRLHGGDVGRFFTFGDFGWQVSRLLFVCLKNELMNYSWMNRFGRRLTFVINCFLVGTSMTATAFSPNYTAYFIFRFLTGLTAMGHGIISYIWGKQFPQLVISIRIFSISLHNTAIKKTCIPSTIWNRMSDIS